MPDLSSVVPAPRFATTLGHDLIKIWNPRDTFFEKSSGQNLPLGPKGAPLPWDSQRAIWRVANPKGEPILSCDPQKGVWPDVYFLPWDSYLF